MALDTTKRARGAIDVNLVTGYDESNDWQKVSIENDNVGLAKDNTLSSILPRDLQLDDGSGTYAKIYRSGNAVLISINEDKVGLATETTLNNINSKITKVDTDNVKVISEVAYDSTNDWKKISVENDAVGLLKTADIPKSSAGNINININENTVGLATESTLSNILSQLDITLSQLRDALNAGEQIYTQLINADESTAQSIILDTKGHKLVDIYASATTATTFTVELSNDNTNWITYYQSASAETSYSNTIQTAFRYVKLSSDAAGTSGTDTVTLILAAK